MGAPPAAGEARAQLIPEEARHALYATATMERDSGSVTAAFHRCRSEVGADRAPADDLVVVRSGRLGHCAIRSREVQSGSSGHSLFVRGGCPLGEARHAELVGGGARLLEKPAALG